MTPAQQILAVRQTAHVEHWLSWEFHCPTAPRGADIVLAPYKQEVRLRRLLHHSACEPSNLIFPPTASSCRAVQYTRPGPSRAVPHPSSCSQKPANCASPTLGKECVLLLLPMPDRRSFQSPRSTFPSQVIRLELEGSTPEIMYSLCGPALQGEGMFLLHA